MLLALSVWQYLIQRLPLRYDPLSWGAVFPLGMYTVATRQMENKIAQKLALPQRGLCQLACYDCGRALNKKRVWGGQT